MPATHEDAQVVLQLMRWGTEMGLEDALRVIFDEGFDAQAAGEDNPAVGKVLLFGETAATLVKHDVLDKDLFIDLLWVEGIWARVEAHALAARDRASEPRLYENFEALVSK